MDESQEERNGSVLESSRLHHEACLAKGKRSSSKACGVPVSLSSELQNLSDPGRRCPFPCDVNVFDEMTMSGTSCPALYLFAEVCFIAD